MHVDTCRLHKVAYTHDMHSSLLKWRTEVQAGAGMTEHMQQWPTITNYSSHFMQPQCKRC